MALSGEEILAGLRRQGIIPEDEGPKRKRGGGTADANTLHEYAVNALNTMRGLSRADKIKVLNRMRKILDA